MRVYTLSKTAREEVLEKIANLTSSTSLKSKQLKIAEDEDTSIALIFEEAEKIYLGRNGDSEYFPLLKDEYILPKLPSITVDSGAIKFVCNGANVMRPGITKLDGEFASSSLVVVKEEKYGKAIAVGKALFSSAELESAKKGSVIENLHYVGDKFWDMLKQISGQG